MPVVSSPNTKPVAPLELPVILLPPLPATEIKVGLGVPLRVILTNGRTSNRNNL